MGSNKNSHIDRVILNNGITLITVENTAAEIISTKIFLKKAGSSRETKEKAGLFHLMAATLAKGTINYSSQEIAQIVESVGASLGAETTCDYFLVSMKTVVADFEKILKLAAEVCRYPSFPVNEVELEKHITLQAIRSQQEVPFNITYNGLKEAIYPEHPYALPVLGTAQTITSITSEDLQAYHRKYFRPDNLVISISGKITTQSASRLVEDLFGDWEIPSETIPPLSLPPLQPQATKIAQFQDTQQAIVMVGYLAAAVTDPDYPVMRLLNTYLGSGLSSRLFVELREKRGLAYDVSSFYPTRLNSSHFVVYMGTAAQNTSISLEGLQAEVQRLRHTRLTEEEVQTSKNKLLGQYALGKQTNAEIAQVLGWYETLGMGVEFDVTLQETVSQVTAETLQIVADRYFHTPYISMVGPEDVVNNN